MDRLLQEAQQEFPDWEFRRAAEGRAATLGGAEHEAASLAALRAALRIEVPGWRVWRSDAGRLWASREQPFSLAAQKADAHRTVDSDDESGLREVIAEMERRAESVHVPTGDLR